MPLWATMCYWNCVYIYIDTTVCHWRISTFWFFKNHLFWPTASPFWKQMTHNLLKSAVTIVKRVNTAFCYQFFNFWRSLPLSRLDGDVSHHPKIHIGNFPKCLIFCISIETPKFRKTVRTHFWIFSKRFLKSNFWCFPLGLFHLHYDVIFTLCSDKPVHLLKCA